MKILLAHNTYQDRGGEDVVFVQERQLLQAAGHEIVEYQRHNSEIRDYSTLRKIGMLGRTVWASDTRQEFADLLRQTRPDVVHIHNTFPLISPSIYWSCRDEQVPIVQTLHNYRLFCPGANFSRNGRTCEDCIDGGFWKGVQHGCYRNSRLQTAPVALMLYVHHARKTWHRMVDCYIALTGFARNKFIQAGLPAEKIVIKPNCVDPDPGMKTVQGTYALCVGRVSDEKGVPTLIKAWQQVPRNYALRVIGDGPARARLEEECKLAGLVNVTFLGMQPRAQVIAAMKEARLVIFPSELYENLPLTIIEAFACGTPVLASRLGAMPEIVEEGRTGWLFEPGNAGDLARTTKHAWDQPEQLRDFGKQARDEYEAKYTAQANLQHLTEIYQSVMNGRSAGFERLRIPLRIPEEVPPA